MRPNKKPFAIADINNNFLRRSAIVLSVPLFVLILLLLLVAVVVVEAAESAWDTTKELLGGIKKDVLKNAWDIW